MSKTNQDTVKEILQKTADESHLKAQEAFLKVKKGKRFDYAIISIASLLYLLSIDNISDKNDVTPLILIATMLSFIRLDYKRKEEELKHDILWKTMQKEAELEDHMKQKNKEELNTDLIICNNELKAFNQRGLASTAMIAGLLTLGGGYLVDKISLSTGSLAGALIMTASAYWMKNHYQNLNAPLQQKFNNIIQIKSLSTREKE